MSGETIRVPAVEGYALWAGHWDQTPSPIVALEERLLALRLAGLRPRRAVDVGCGTGRWTQRLGAVGVDASPEMLAIAARKPGLRGRLAIGDVLAVPLATGCADLVLCALTLGHVRDHARAMRELGRILAPGGTLLLTDFHPSAAAQGWRRTFRHENSVYELENHPYTVSQLCEADAGLALVDRVEAAIGEPEREVFDRAARPDLFDAARRVPAVLVTWWTRV